MTQCTLMHLICHAITISICIHNTCGGAHLAPGCQAQQAHDGLSSLGCPGFQSYSHARIAVSAEVLLDDTQVLYFRHAVHVHWVQVS